MMRGLRPIIIWPRPYSNASVGAAGRGGGGVAGNSRSSDDDDDDDADDDELLETSDEAPAPPPQPLPTGLATLPKEEGEAYGDEDDDVSAIG